MDSNKKQQHKEINGKQTNVGDKVHYTDHMGLQNEAEITKLHDDDEGHGHADLKHANGTVERAPFHPGGTAHSWMHQQ